MDLLHFLVVNLVHGFSSPTRIVRFHDESLLFGQMMLDLSHQQNVNEKVNQNKYEIVEDVVKKVDGEKEPVSGRVRLHHVDV